ncbi:hypothetical protein HAX54_015565, partial [Datura stramonium]|nr:hypothetical protein [Datura stramonium]
RNCCLRSTILHPGASGSWINSPINYDSLVLVVVFDRLQANTQNPRFTCASWVDINETPVRHRKIEKLYLVCFQDRVARGDSRVSTYVPPLDRRYHQHLILILQI